MTGSNTTGTVRETLIYWVAAGTLMLGTAIGTVGCNAAEGAGPPPCESGSCESYFFVLNELVVAEPDFATNTAPGFNLDGRVSTGSDPAGCNFPDYQSRSGAPGVDNQLGEVIASLDDSINVEELLDDAILDGKVLVLVEVDDLDDLKNDGNVTLNVYLGEAQSMLVTDDSGRLAPGQQLRVAASSLDSGASRTSAQGILRNGRLSAGPIDLTLDLPFEGKTVRLAIGQAEMAFDLAQNTISGGVLGGSLDVDSTVATVKEVAPDFGDLADRVVRRLADLDADADGVCQSISVGLEFSGTHAVKSP